MWGERRTQREQFRKELSYVPADRVKVIFRKSEDPLPLD